MDALSGYRGDSLRFLKEAGAEIGDVLEVTTAWGTVKGTLVPRYLYDDDQHIVLKLPSGYNAGLKVVGLKGAVVKAKGEAPAFKRPSIPRGRGGLPRVAILGTGGTIASRVDYRTGAVRPAVSAEELHALIPELSERAKVEPEILFNVYSENMEPSIWTALAERVAKLVEDGVEGVVITHGTDTMGYTSAALSFALQKVPIPVVIVGSQRSSDRPSSDAVLNLIGAVSIAASAEFSGVYLLMHVDSNDDRLALHRATRVRKNHTSARGAFESIGVPLAAVWSEGGFEYLDDSLPPRRKERKYRASSKFDPKAVLLKFYPSMPATTIEALFRAGTKALVLEGTGLGHVNRTNIEALRKLLKKGGAAFMSSQCINGRVDLEVYDTGKDLLDAGVVPLEDMLAETALVKCMWALANSSSGKELAEIMTSNLCGEITTRSLDG